MYLDVLQAQRVLLIAVQKRPLNRKVSEAKGQPPAVWVNELTTEQMQAGCKKYNRLLRAHAELPAPLSILAP